MAAAPRRRDGTRIAALLAWTGLVLAGLLYFTTGRPLGIYSALTDQLQLREAAAAPPTAERGAGAVSGGPSVPRPPPPPRQAARDAAAAAKSPRDEIDAVVNASTSTLRAAGVMTYKAVRILPLTDCGPNWNLPPPTLPKPTSRDLKILLERHRSKCKCLAGFASAESYVVQFPDPVAAVRVAAPGLLALIESGQPKKGWVSPCWNATTGALRCLPAYYLIGQIKSGTTEIYERINAHPSASRHFDYRKELTFWSSLASDGFWDWTDRAAAYVDTLGDSLKAFRRLRPRTPDPPSAARLPRPQQPAPVAAGVPMAGRMLGDGSPQYFSEMGPFHRYCPPLTAAEQKAGGPFEAGPECSPFITAHQMISAASAAAGAPAPRLALLLRDPVLRLESNYWFQHRYSWIPGLKEEPPTAKNFHAAVVASIERFLACYHKQGVLAWAARSCGEAEANCGCVPFGAIGGATPNRGVDVTRGLYSEHLQLWLRVFNEPGPEKGLLVLRIEDYDKAPRAFMRKLFAHLRFGDLADADPVWEDVLAAEDDRHYAGPTDATLRRSNMTIFKREPMLPETRAMLQAFYAPFNRKLARLLGDDAFLYGTPPVEEES